jgi:secreted PhoX family phosphatase
MHKLNYLTAVCMAGIATGAVAAANYDFGLFRDHQLAADCVKLFGVTQPIASSSTASVDAATAEADSTTLATFARGLQARVVSAEPNLGANIDMMALWPRENPTHLIACNEQGTGQPGLQRVRLSDGLVETILTGTSSCDPAHVTPWGTVVFAEEAGNTGTLLEIIDPLNTTGVTYDRATHTLGGADAGNVAVRPAVGHLSFEGVAVYPGGVLYYGDENRPATGTAGGAYFKFIPASPWDGDGPISDLSESPLTAGSVYGLRLGKRSGNTDYGQGSNTGLGSWVMVANAYDADLRAAAANLELTGYYRPEDAGIDLSALAAGKVRFCANNTGNEEADNNWGETICVTDGTLEEAALNTAEPEVQLLTTGTREFAMMDNIAYQPGRGNWIIQEDGDAPGFIVNPHNNDIWSCLEDGGDVDTLTDGCVRIATLNDLNAESTGGFFDSTGAHYYVSIQHNVTGHGVILDVTGWH